MIMWCFNVLNLSALEQLDDIHITSNPVTV